MVKKVVLDSKSMGIPTPVIARGINPHEAMRQSALALDGPALDSVIRANMLVLVDAAPNGIPGFRTVPAAGDVVAYAAKKGFNIAGAADVVQAFIDKFASRFGIVWFGNEQAEMNLLDPFLDTELADVIGNDTVECEFNNVVMLKDAYITHVILPVVDDQFVDKVLDGGCLKLVKVGTGVDGVAAGTLVLSASIDETDASALAAVYGTGAVSYDIPGTTVVKASPYSNNAGQTFTTIDFVC